MFLNSQFIIRMHSNQVIEMKLKISEFIEDYERQIGEQQYHKQKLKQSIMLEIMSTRHQSQTSQSAKQDMSRIDSNQQFNAPQEFNEQQYFVQNCFDNQQNCYLSHARSNSVPNIHQNQQIQTQFKGPQITFKASNQQNLFTPTDSSKKESEDSSFENQNINQQQNIRHPTYIPLAATNTQQQPMDNSKRVANKSRGWQVKSKKKQKFPQVEVQPEQDWQKSSLQNNHQNNGTQSNQEKGGFFLTMQQQKSMEVLELEKKKNCAFNIVMDKSQGVEDFDQLKKRKIEDLDKKRKERMQKKKDQQESKANRSIHSLKNIEKGKASNEKKSAIEGKPNSKSNKRIGTERDLASNVNIVEVTHNTTKHQAQPPRKTNQKQRNENHGSQCLQTPQSMNSSYIKTKSRGKTTIFKQSPKRNDKSPNKFTQQPKIQPKDRRNTFSKQSNKKLMIGSLTNVCLQGELNRKQRQKLIQVIENQQSQFIVFLFKEYTRKSIKAIYALDSSQTCLQKIYGEKAPQEIVAQSVKSFYRFDSGSREFKKIDGCKSLSFAVHAIDLG